MAWNEEYYQIVRRYYWTPNDLDCMRRIPLCSDCERQRRNSGKPHSNDDAVIDRLRRREVPLNDIFNLFFRIAPPWATSRVFASNFDRAIDADLEVLDDDVAGPYGFGTDNVTQQDLLFTGHRHRLGIELKTDTKSNLLQLAKYALLFALEDRQRDRRAEEYFFILMTPEMPLASAWKEGFTSADQLEKAFGAFDPVAESAGPVRERFIEHRQSVGDIQRKIRIDHMPYTVFAAALERVRDTAETEETLTRLIDGMLAELNGRGYAP